MSEATSVIEARNSRRLRVGVVTSNKSTQTIKVVFNYKVKHRKYGKYVSRRTILHAHDPKSECQLGDKVEVAACRPISKTKNWRLVRIIERGQGV